MLSILIFLSLSFSHVFSEEYYGMLYLSKEDFPPQKGLVFLTLEVNGLKGVQQPLHYEDSLDNPYHLDSNKIEEFILRTMEGPLESIDKIHFQWKFPMRSLKDEKHFIKIQKLAISSMTAKIEANSEEFNSVKTFCLENKNQEVYEGVSVPLLPCHPVTLEIVKPTGEQISL